MIQYLITNERPGATRVLLADYSARVLGLTFATNNRGFAECTAFVPMGLSEAFSLYNTLGLLRVYITDTSAGITYDGRLEDIAITGSGVTLTALGFSRALSDTLYTALWSDAKVTGWSTVTSAQIGNAVPDQWNIDTNNRLYLGCKKGATYPASGAAAGMLTYAIPDLSTRQIVGVQYSYSVTLPVGMTARLDLYSSSYVYGSTVWTLNGTGANLTGCIHGGVTASDRLVLLVFNASGAGISPAGEDGANFVRLTGMRVVTSIANRVNTTLGTTILAGTRVVAPGSMARIHVGQQLYINQNATGAEVVTVQAITATTFTAVFANGHNLADSVTAHVIYGDEIANDLITTTNALNSNQLSSTTALVRSPALDMLNESYQDRAPCDILDYLASVGDSSGNEWEWGVKADQRLYFQAQGTNARTWYIDVSDLVMTRLLDQLTNSVYATYVDGNNRTLRTAALTDPGSIARYGLTRKTVVNVSTTSATQASLEQVVTLADGKNPIPQSGVTIDRVFDANGQRWPLWYVQAGDTMVIRNLPPTLSSAIDRVRVFRLARAAYSFDDDTLELEPESPLPKLDALLARLAAGINASVGGFRIKGAPGQRVPL